MTALKNATAVESVGRGRDADSFFKYSATNSSAAAASGVAPVGSAV